MMVVLQVIIFQYSNCDYEIGNTTSEEDLDCRSTCRNKLVEVKNVLGYCVNYYNRSYLDYPSDISSLANGHWKSCGVETPGFCESN